MRMAKCISNAMCRHHWLGLSLLGCVKPNLFFPLCQPCSTTLASSPPLALSRTPCPATLLQTMQAFIDRITSIDSHFVLGVDPRGSTASEIQSQVACILTPDILAQAAAIKPNAAFFEAVAGGTDVLRGVVATATAAGVPVLLDYKRGDIGSTMDAYVQAAQELGAAAVTVNAWMGTDVVEPALKAGLGVFVLARTSNPGAADFQERLDSAGRPWWHAMATQVEAWAAEYPGQLGLVVGATCPGAVAQARKLAPSAWILAPGVGAQGGDLTATLQAGAWPSTGAGRGILIPVSRGVSGAADPLAAARDVCAAIRATLAGDAPAPAAAAAASSALSPSAKQLLSLAQAAGALKFGSFTLKSGRQSPYFFNAGLFTSGAALASLAACYAEVIVGSGLEFDVVFGPAYKGIPLGALVAAALAARGVHCQFAYNRKEAKDHGEGGTLVGASLSGAKVLVVDDVISAGTAIRESASLLSAASAELVGVAVALDRQEVGPDGATSAVQAVQRDLAVPVLAVATLQQLLQFVQESGSAPADVQAALQAYRAKYGAC